MLSRNKVRKEVRVPSRYLDANLIIYALNASIADSYVPWTYQEAVSCPDSSKWHFAMENESESLKKHNTWILVTKPENKKIILCQWVDMIKNSLPIGDSNCLKAKLVEKRFT